MTNAQPTSDAEPSARGPSHQPGLPLARNVAWWLVALTVSGLLVGRVELHRRHYASPHLAIRIIGGIVVWLGLAALIRFVVFLGVTGHRRLRRGRV
jgi:hypothetical protein